MNLSIYQWRKKDILYPLFETCANNKYASPKLLLRFHFVLCEQNLIRIDMIYQDKFCGKVVDNFNSCPNSLKSLNSCFNKIDLPPLLQAFIDKSEIFWSVIYSLSALINIFFTWKNLTKSREEPCHFRVGQILRCWIKI